MAIFWQCIPALGIITFNLKSLQKCSHKKYGNLTTQKSILQYITFKKSREKLHKSMSVRMEKHRKEENRILINHQSIENMNENKNNKNKSFSHPSVKPKWSVIVSLLVSTHINTFCLLYNIDNIHY